VDPVQAVDGFQFAILPRIQNCRSEAKHLQGTALAMPMISSIPTAADNPEAPK